MIRDAEHLFKCLLAIYLYVLGRMSVQVFCPFINQVVCFSDIELYMSCLYVLDINPLLVISFVNIFSHSVGCFFILLMASFAVPKL